MSDATVETSGRATRNAADPVDHVLDRVRAHLDDHLRDAPSAARERAFEGHPPRSRFLRLRAIFDLDDYEMDVLASTFAVAIDPDLGVRFGALAGDPRRAWPTEPLVARIFGHSLGVALSSESNLRAFGVVREPSVGAGEPAALVLDPHVRDYLVGRDELPLPLVDVARAVSPEAPLAAWDIEAIVERIRRVLEANPSGRARLVLRGAPGSGRRTLAATVAARLGLRALAIDSSLLVDHAFPALWADVQRHALLAECVPVWIGEGAAAREPPLGVGSFPLQVVTAGARDVLAPWDGFADVAAELAVPALDERLALWRRFAPSLAADGEGLSRLAGTFRVHVGEIARVAAVGPTGVDHAFAEVRELTRSRMTDLAQRLECPFDWDDIVLPEPTLDALRDLAFEARDRLEFWESPSAQRLFPQGRGLVALLTGSPGTGKTMAAQVLARDLGVDLFRIDLSAVISKWVGETAKNLERVLDGASRMDVVLLFDEADALFAKRVGVQDAQDRHANADTDHLLQAIEGYDGIAVLASNKRSHMDPAFTRRIRWVLELTPPTAEHRIQIWSRVIAGLFGEDDAARMAPPLEALARTIEITGAQIKSAALHAAFAARRGGSPLGRDHLVRGVERELLKEGRSLSTRDRERLADAR